MGYMYVSFIINVRHRIEREYYLIYSNKGEGKQFGKFAIEANLSEI